MFAFLRSYEVSRCVKYERNRFNTKVISVHCRNNTDCERPHEFTWEFDNVGVSDFGMLLIIALFCVNWVKTTKVNVYSVITQ